MNLNPPMTAVRKRHGAFSRRFSKADGAIDLASIMVGVLAIGIVGGVIAASISAVIPWAQDGAAKGNLDAVAGAESAVRSLDGTYMVYDSHPDSEYQAFESGKVGIDRPGQRLVVEVSDDGREWVATQESASGEIFLSTSASPEVFRAVDLGYVAAAATSGGFSGIRSIVIPPEFRAVVPDGVNAAAPGAMVTAVVEDALYDFGDPMVRPVILAGARASIAAPCVVVAGHIDHSADVSVGGFLDHSNDIRMPGFTDHSRDTQGPRGTINHSQDVVVAVRWDHSGDIWVPRTTDHRGDVAVPEHCALAGE